MAFNNHIGIFATMEEFQAKVNLLETPWVAYVGTPGSTDYKVIYPNDLVVKDEAGVNIAEEILRMKPVICTQDEYDILISTGSGYVTGTDGITSGPVDYDPEIFYYTYDASELEEAPTEEKENE